MTINVIKTLPDKYPLADSSAKVKKASEEGFVYIKVKWVTQAAKGALPLTTKVVWQAIQNVINKNDNLPRGKDPKSGEPYVHILLKEDTGTVKMGISLNSKREGWIRFQNRPDMEKGVRHFQQLMDEKYGNGVDVGKDNLNGPLTIIQPVKNGR